MTTYIQAIGWGFPAVQCHAVGDGSVYENLVYDSGDPIPSKATLDAWIAANPTAGQIPDGLQVKNGNSNTGRSIVGTTNQLQVANGNGTAGDPTISLVPNPVIPGNAGVVVPVGAVAQRPASPQEGAFRLNQDADVAEMYINGSWVQFAIPASANAICARRSTTQALTNVATAITFDSVDLVTNAAKIYRDGTNTNRIYVTESGLYLVSLCLTTVDSVSAQTHTFRVLVNGVAISHGTRTIRPGNATTPEGAIVVPVSLAAGDYVSVDIARSGNTGTSTLQIGATLAVCKLDGPQGPQGPIGGDNVYRYFASEFDNPTSANWAVNALAPAIAEATNGLVVRAFDDTAEEGVGFMLNVPSGVNNLTLSLKLRPATAQASSLGAVFKLYNRGIPDGAAVTSWASSLLGTIQVQAATFTYINQVYSLASLNIVAGRLTQFELTRVGSNASDTVVGDMYLVEAAIAFS